MAEGRADSVVYVCAVPRGLVVSEDEAAGGGVVADGGEGGVEFGGVFPVRSGEDPVAGDVVYAAAGAEGGIAAPGGVVGWVEGVVGVGDGGERDTQLC